MKSRPYLSIFGIYLIVSLLMSLPMILSSTHFVAGTGGDPWQVLWRFDHKQQQLGEALSTHSLGNFLFTEFLGGGTPRLINLSVWPWMPLHIVFGEPFTYNLIWLLSFVLAGYGMYLVVHYLVHKTLEIKHIDKGALLAGGIYMFLPYHVAHAMGHFGALQIQWLPFIILLSIVWFYRPSTWKTVGLGVLLTLQAWSEHHYMLWLGVLLLVTVILKYPAIKVQFMRHKKDLVRYGLLLLAFLVFGVLLPYLPTIRLAVSGSGSLELGEDQLTRFSADLFSYVVPAPFHTIWGPFFQTQFADSFTGNISESTLYLGVVSLLLLAFFHQPIPQPQFRYWGIVLLVFMLISFGPSLHVFGVVTSIPLPYALISHLPVISTVRAVARAGVIVGLSLSVLIGLLLSKQLRRVGSTAILAGLLALDFLFLPVPMQSTVPSPAYAEVKKMPGSSLIEIPAATNYTIASRALYESISHGKDVVGNIALERAATSSAQDVSKILPGIRQILYLRTTELREGRNEFFDQSLADSLLDTMAWLKAKSILVHKDSLSPLQFSALDRFFQSISLNREDFDDVVLYTIPDNKVGDGVFLTRGEGWEHVGYDEKRGAVFAEIPSRAIVSITNITDKPKYVRLRLPLAPESASGVNIRYGDKTFSSNQQIQVAPGENMLEIEATDAQRAIIMNPQLIVENK